MNRLSIDWAFVFQQLVIIFTFYHVGEKKETSKSNWVVFAGCLMWLTFNLYLCQRQLTLLRVPTSQAKFPPKMAEIWTQDTFRLAKQYEVARLTFKLNEKLVKILTILVLVFLGNWRNSLFSTAVLRGKIYGHLPTTAVYMLESIVFRLYLILAYLTVTLLLRARLQFKIEEKFGFHQASPDDDAIRKRNQILMGLVATLVLFWAAAFFFLISTDQRYDLLDKSHSHEYYMERLGFLQRIFLTVFILLIEFAFHRIDNANLYEADSSAPPDSLRDLARTVVNNTTEEIVEVRRFLDGHSHVFGGVHLRVILSDNLLDRVSGEERYHVGASPGTGTRMAEEEIKALVVQQLSPEIRPGSWQDVVQTFILLILPGLLCWEFLVKPPPLSQVCFVLLVICGEGMFWFKNWTRNHRVYKGDLFAMEKGHGGSLETGLIKMAARNLESPVQDGAFAARYCEEPALLKRLEGIRFGEGRKN